MKFGLIVLTMGVITMCSSKNMIEDSINMKNQIGQAIRNGEFTVATQLITQYLEEAELSEQDRKVYAFEIERLNRVRADFTETPEEVLS